MNEKKQRGLSDVDASWIKSNIDVWIGLDEAKSTHEAFHKGRIIEVKSDIGKISVKDLDANVVVDVAAEKIFQVNKDSQDGYDDMVNMENLNEAELLFNIKKRFERQSIFTYVGPTLLVVNPYMKIPELFSEKTLNTYQEKILTPVFSLKDAQPHVYALALLAIRQLSETNKNQAIVISGESGAGKTENTKFAMKFLTSVGKASYEQKENFRPLFKERKSTLLIVREGGIEDGGHVEDKMDPKAEKRKSGKNENVLRIDPSASPNDKKRPSVLREIVHMEGAFEGIEEKILSCNPVLEAFGNAKTSRNDNSSRFGKLVLLLVHKDTRKIKGAVMTNYLLEKSRVIMQGQGERNYHIFYHLLKGADKEFLKELELKDMKSYEYLKSSGCYDVPTVNDVELYKEVCTSFKVMHFAAEEQQAIWGIVASVLHLGNCSFEDTNSQSSQNPQNNTPCQIINRENLKVAARLLGIGEEDLVQAFTYKLRVIGNQQIKSNVAKDDCLTQRDSFTKGLYERLFNWIVKRLNWAISTPEYRNMKLEALIMDKNRYSIGLLDIFGFEVFKKNTFEQFCINFANEKLQQLYISYVFKGEIKEFIDEGLKDFLYELTFKDNQPIIDLFENYPTGIFHLLDESTSVSSTDQALLVTLGKIHKTNENFRTPKTKGDTFIIVHTAKDVEYSTTGFRMKNKDELSTSILESMYKSKFPAVRRIFFNVLEGEDIQKEEDEDEKPKAGAKAKKSSSDKFLGAKFRLQMKDLMTELNSCDVHFIRCIKPNEEKKKELFIPTLSLMQIRYLGVLDSIRVRKESYPIRKLYKNFYQVYGELDPVSSKTSFLEHCRIDSNFRELSKEVISQALPGVGTELILFGQRKIFMRIQIVARLDRILAEKRGFFRYQQRKKLKVVFKSIRRIQNLWRCRFEYQKFKKFCKSLRKLQNWGRKINFNNKLEKALDRLRRGRKGLIKLQARVRMKVQRKIFLEYKNSAELINRCVRRFLAKICVYRLRICRRVLMDHIFELAWKKIRRRWEKDAAVIIQKYARGYLVRKRHQDKVKKIRIAVLDFKMKKACFVIQRYTRGFLARNKIRNWHKAAFKIQGFVKMKWLSGLFQSLRKNVRVIQRCVRKFLINKRIMKERWTDYKSEDIKQYEALRNLERDELFGNKNFTISSGKLNHNGSALSLSPSNMNILPNHELDTEEEFLKFLEREQEEIDEADLEYKRDGNQEAIDESVYEEIVTYSYKGTEADSSRISPKARMKQTHEESDVSLNRKIVLFSLVVDLDLIGDTTELYKPLWSTLFNQAKKEAAKTDSNFQIIEVGETFTAAVTDTGKIYTWGWNDFNQLGRYTDPQGEASTVGPIESDMENLEPHRLVAGDNHCFVLDKNRNVYSWGDNFNGQLGMGSNKIVSRITQNKVLPPKRVIDVQSKGAYNVAILEDGKVLNWPFQKVSGKYIYKPVELPLPLAVSITSLSCGNNFVMLQSSGGLLYSFGRDNSEGQLGHGDTNPRTIPTLVQKLKNLGEKVHKVSCGFKHVICRTGLGKIYTWGAGDCGQLGTGHLNNETVPRVINTDKLTSLKSKVVQIKAGFRSCMILLDNAKVFWWGTNSSLQKQAQPVRMDFTHLIQAENDEMLNDYLPVRLCSSWNKTLGLLYITIADTTRITESKLLTKRLCNILSSKWEDQTINPPFIESISRHFTFKALNKIRINASVSEAMFGKLSPKGSQTGLQSPKQLTREEKEKILSLFNLREVSNVSSPTQKSLSRVSSGPGSLLRGKSPGGIERVIEKNKEEKLKQIKTKIITLMKTPKEAWTASEQELMRVLSDPKVLALIRKI